MLAARGAVILNADVLVSEIRQPGGLAYVDIVHRFGDGVVAADGTLDRHVLAAIGSDEAGRAELRAVTYPHLDKLMEDRIAAHRDTDDIVVLDIIPRLAEAGTDAYGLAAVVVVDVPVDEAVRRLALNRGVREEDARARIEAQMTREARLALADVVIDNSGPLEHLGGQVESLWDWLLTLRHRTTQP
jgi:dephospho-CoA kinase